MAFKNPEDHRKFMREWYATHREEQLAKGREYARNHKEEIRKSKSQYRQRPDVKEHLRAYNLKRYHDDPEYRKRSLELAKERRREYRENLLLMLGRKCIDCGFADLRALQIDHIHGGGRKEFKEDPRLIKVKIYTEHIKKNRNKYQLLCANCNWIKRFANNEIPRYH